MIIATKRDPARRWAIEFSDLAYGNPPKSHLLKAGQDGTPDDRDAQVSRLVSDLNWLSGRIERIIRETLAPVASRRGKWSTSDPAMGRPMREATASGKIEPHPPILLRS